MNILYCPPNGSGAYSEVVFGIGAADPAKVCFVRIMDESNVVVGKKRYTGAKEYDVNVAPYAAGMLDVKPVPPYAPRFNNISGRTRGLFIKVAEEEQSMEGEPANSAYTLASDEILVTAGVESAVTGRFLTSSPALRNISPYGFDELSFLATGGRMVAEVTLDGVDPDDSFTVRADGEKGRIYTFKVSPEWIASQAYVDPDRIEGFTISITPGEESAAISKTYNIRQFLAGEVHFCWLNRFGFPDYYSFSPNGSSYESRKAKAYTGAGYIVTSALSEEAISYVSTILDSGTLSWLREILVSPKVWIHTGNEEFRQVDIIGEGLEIRTDIPGYIKFSCRPLISTKHQDHV